MGEIRQPLLIRKGAEASLYIADFHGRKVIMKKRLPKRYRMPKLDEQIKAYRTMHEPQLIHEAKKAGVGTPVILMVDIEAATIIMEFIEGKQVKELLSEVSASERKDLCLIIGKLIGRLHSYGMVHGDLTTSNLIQNSEGKILFVDFGLGEKTKELEAWGVDLHLMRRALQSTHSKFADECFNAVIEGYSKVLGSENSRKVLDKIHEIEKRGRYIAERKSD